jgi:hypothetical protein
MSPDKIIDTIRVNGAAHQETLIMTAAYSEQFPGLPGAFIELQTIFKGDYFIIGTVNYQDGAGNRPEHFLRIILKPA